MVRYPLLFPVLTSNTKTTGVSSQLPQYDKLGLGFSPQLRCGLAPLPPNNVDDGCYISMLRIGPDFRSIPLPNRLGLCVVVGCYASNIEVLI